MSLSSEYGKSCAIEIRFKDGSYVNSRIDIPLDLILEIHSWDEYGDPIYIEMTHEEQLKEQIPYIQNYLETWCEKNLNIQQIDDIDAGFDDYEFCMVLSASEFKIEAKCTE